MLMTALLLQTGAAMGAPVYLTCTLNDRAGSVVFDVQLNEAANTATYTFTRDGITRTVSNRAMFTADRVTYSVFTISRTDLSFQRDNTQSAFYEVTKDRVAVDRGQCEISKTKKAF